MEKLISNIVFTKNRPLQLDGYLESLYRYFPAELIQTYIIYKVDRFEQEYDRLFKNYPENIVIRENDFHSDFLQLLHQINTKYILFGIDDVVYFDSVDLEVIEETFNSFSEDFFGFTLRFSEDTIIKAKEPIRKARVAEQTIYGIDWTRGRTPITRYPFELCATIYPTTLVQKVINSTMSNSSLTKVLFSPDSILIKALSSMISTRSILKSIGYFFSPNTLESWPCRWCQNHSNQLPGFIFFQKQCATAIQVNMVNTSTVDRGFCASSEYAVNVLADKYQQGHRLDIDHIAAKKPSGTHSGPEYFRLIHNEALSIA